MRISILMFVVASAAACKEQKSDPNAEPVSTTTITAGTPKIEALFVQSTKQLAFDGKTLTLKDPHPTIYFSDRPDRIVGHMTNEDFVDMWGKGKDSFLSDPPNANVSMLEDSGPHNAVVVLRNPRLEGTDLVYDAKVLQGELPKASMPSSVFIDIIGMPRTPMSFAGAARRRAFFRY